MNAISPGEIIRSQSGTDYLFLPVTASYVRPVWGPCRASLKWLRSMPGITPSLRQAMIRLSRWL